MKTLVAISAILLLTISTILAKKDPETTDKVRYGALVSEIDAGTGHGSGYSINANVLEGRKSLEVGIIYSKRDSKFAGADFKYRILLGNIHQVEDENRLFKPYLQYNLLYQKSISYAPERGQIADLTMENPPIPGVVTTFGHFLAYGNKIRFFGNLYFDSSLGFGLFSGLLNEPTRQGTWIIKGTNTGFTYSFKIGIGYNFN